MRVYGSLNNRFDENHYFNGSYGNLQVGTLATRYYWSDRHAYEVTKVIDQEHVFVRQLRAIRTDDNGMSEIQDYRYESEPRHAEEEIKRKNGKWREVIHYEPAYYAKKIAELAEHDRITLQQARDMWAEWLSYKLTPNQTRKLLDEGKEVIKLGGQVNISFGVADEYYDYSF